MRLLPQGAWLLDAAAATWAWLVDAGGPPPPPAGRPAPGLDPAKEAAALAAWHARRP